MAFRLTARQEKAVAIIPIFTAGASIFGSIAVIASVVHEHRRKRTNPYLRIMLALSSFDVLSSITIALGHFAVPASFSDRVWSFGNESTCIAAATIWQLSECGVVFYSGYLSFYFLLTIRFGMTAKNFARQVEPWMHGLAIVWSVGTAIFGATIGMFGPQIFISGCWVKRQPKGFNKRINLSTVALSWVILGGVWFVFFVAVCINYLIIFKFVRSTIARGRRHTSTFHSKFSRQDSCSLDFELESNNNNFPKRSRRSLDSQSRRIQEVATQGGFYVLAFTISNVTYAVARNFAVTVDNISDERRWFPFMVFHQLVVPLQGAMNMAVYFRPKYIRCRSRFSDQTRLWALRRSIFGESVLPVTKCCSEQPMAPEDPSIHEDVGS